MQATAPHLKPPLLAALAEVGAMLARAHQHTVEAMYGDDEMAALVAERAPSERFDLYRSIRLFRGIESRLRQECLTTLEAALDPGTSHPDASHALPRADTPCRAMLLGTLCSAAEQAYSAMLRAVGDTPAARDIRCLAPRAIAHTYLDMLLPHRFAPELLQALLREFEHHVLRRLEHAYRHLDALPPDTRFHEDHCMMPALSVRSPDQNADAAGTLQAILRILTERRCENAAGATKRGYAPDAVMAALDAVQARAAATAQISDVAVDSAVPLVKAVDSLLWNASPRPMAQALARNDAALLELVDLYFACMFGEEEVEPPIRHLVLPLRIAYAKVVLLDRGFFVDERHAARRVLEEIARLARTWSESTDRTLRVRSKIKSSALRILVEFQRDLAFFETMQSDLDDWVRRHLGRSELSEQRAIHGADGRERLRLAWVDAIDAVEPGHACCVASRPVAAAFLARAWAQYLVIVHSREGFGSAAWHDATAAVEALAREAAPERCPELKSRLAALSALTPTFALGLSRVGYSRQATHALLHALRQEASGDASQDPACVLDLGESIQTAKHTFDLRAPGSAIAPQTNGDIGTWWNLNDGPAIKLSWIGPTSRVHLFVNRTGCKAIELSDRQVCEAIAHGRLRPALSPHRLGTDALGHMMDALGCAGIVARELIA